MQFKGFVICQFNLILCPHDPSEILLACSHTHCHPGSGHPLNDYVIMLPPSHKSCAVITRKICLDSCWQAGWGRVATVGKSCVDGKDSDVNGSRTSDGSRLMAALQIMIMVKTGRIRPEVAGILAKNVRHSAYCLWIRVLYSKPLRNDVRELTLQAFESQGQLLNFGILCLQRNMLHDLASVLRIFLPTKVIIFRWLLTSKCSVIWHIFISRRQKRDDYLEHALFYLAILSFQVSCLVDEGFVHN